MNNKKKFVAIGASVLAAVTLITAGTFSFFIDKDWTSDTGKNGTVYLNVKDLVFTNSENINPGDYDKDVYIESVANNSTSSLREGTEHKITFTVDNVGTKSVMTRNLITITVENTLFEPLYYKDGEKAYDEGKEVAPDNHMYYCDFANNPIEIVEDELENKYIKGTEVTYNQTTGKYEYVDAVTNDKITFTKDSTKYKNIVHWRVGNIPADAYGLLYEVHKAEEEASLVQAGVKNNIIIDSTEIDCIPKEAGIYAKTDLYALHSSDVGAQFEVFSRDFFSSKSTAISIRYITPQISLTAPEGSIEDNDGTKDEQTIALTQGGEVRAGDTDSVYYTYWLYMDKDAPNIYKGATVYFDVEVQGMQYRNTSDAEWKTLFTKSYYLTVENAEQGYESVYGNIENNK